MLPSTRDGDASLSETAMTIPFSNAFRDLQPTGRTDQTSGGPGRLQLTAPVILSPSSAQTVARLPGRVCLDADRLRLLRQARLMSQQDLANDFSRRNIQISIATIKRAEAGHPVRYRIVRELARYFDQKADLIVRTHP
jgi:hypothetical protein